MGHFEDIMKVADAMGGHEAGGVTYEYCASLDSAAFCSWATAKRFAPKAVAGGRRSLAELMRAAKERAAVRAGRV